MNPRPAHVRSAFTLLELIVVLAIGAMLTGVAVWSLRGPLRAATLAAALEQLESFDQVVRSHARRTGRSAELTINLTAGTLTAVEPQPGQPTRRLAIGPGLKIDRVAWADRRFSNGQVVVAVSAHGTSRTYALRVRGAEKSQWILFAGVTGQSVRVSDDKELEQLLEPLSAGRADSD
jgi:prepilin-type N-terminal cleavage/methylation domain-containing protein